MAQLFHPNHSGPTARPTQMPHVLGLVGWLAVCALAAAIGTLAASEAGNFYSQLAQPDWAPPAWLFAPVWTVLYAMMGVAAWRVWRAHGWSGAAPALVLFMIQLAANALWTWLFFGWHLGAESMAEIAVLWLLIAATIQGFARLDQVAALLLLPYLVWVSFASVLTFAMWQMNPILLG